MSVAKPPKALMMGDWKMNYDVVPVKGIGFNAACGGFSEILIGDQDYPASIVARYVLLHDELVATATAALADYDQRLARDKANRVYDWIATESPSPSEARKREALRAVLTKATTP